MSETGGESYSPGEGGSSAPEQLSEEAKQRFAAAAAAMQAAQRDEKRSKKRDTRVARTIIQFLNDDRYAHLFVLISRLVARDCPSVFILAIVSLINDDCRTVVDEYLAEAGAKAPDHSDAGGMQLAKATELEHQTSEDLIDWITRMQMVLSLETTAILMHLMVDRHNIDGTVLQLTTFTLQEFFASEKGGKKHIPFENLHTFTASVLQAVFDPFMNAIDWNALPAKDRQKGEEDE